MMSREDAEVTHDEADITLVSYMLTTAENGAATIQIVSDETDVFVLLVYLVWKCRVTAEVRMEKWDRDGSMLSINRTVPKVGDKCKGLLAMPALSGCDTTHIHLGRERAITALN